MPAPGWGSHVESLIVVILCVVVVYALRSAVTDRLLQVGLHLILGGAIGNLVDRFRFGYVVDFLDFYVRDHHWPAFNIADSAIVVGVGLMLLDSLIGEKQRAP